MATEACVEKKKKKPKKSHSKLGEQVRIGHQCVERQPPPSSLTARPFLAQIPSSQVCVGEQEQRRQISAA